MRFLAFLALCCLSVLAQAQTLPQAPTIAAKSWLLLDYSTGQALASYNPDDRVEPASLTKLMTAYVVLGALKEGRLKPDQALPVSERAWKTPGSRMFIEPRKPVTVDELLRGMIVQSGNDACIALAEAVAGSEEAFAQMMNREAQRLGLKATRFANATGLSDPQHYSTARDLGALAAALIRDYPEYDMKSRLWLDRLALMLKSGNTEGLNDTSFPTIDLDDPGRLLPEEQEIIDDLARQFATNRRLKRLLRFFFTEGQTYLIHNNFLNIHALVPSTADGEWATLCGWTGIAGEIRKAAGDLAERFGIESICITRGAEGAELGNRVRDEHGVTTREAATVGILGKRGGRPAGQPEALPPLRHREVGVPVLLEPGTHLVDDVVAGRGGPFGCVRHGNSIADRDEPIRTEPSGLHRAVASTARRDPRPSRERRPQ